MTNLFISNHYKSPFLDKIISIDFSSSLPVRLFTVHLLVYYFISTSSPNCTYDNFMNFTNTFSKDIPLHNVSITHITKEDFINLYNEFHVDNQILDIINNNYLINIIYDIFTNSKQLKSYLKEFNLYYTDLKYINYINTIINNLKPHSICNLFSGFGKLIYNMFDNNKQFTCVDENPYILLISYINLLIKNKEINNITFKINNVITDDILNTTYDLVLADLPDDIRNLIYANCNSKIKFLKIRGTKSEPLIIQYISQILNKNGVGIIITSNSFLFGDSNQHINTRKYIIENFGVKIIDLDNKKSILIINKIKNNKIIFNFFENNDTYEFTINDIIKNNYSFYYYNYNKNIITTQNNNKININCIVNIDSIVNIVKFDKNKKYDNENILYSYKNNLFNIDNINNITNADYLFILKNKNIYNQEYINNKLLHFFNLKIKNIIKGKTNQLNIDIIKQLELELPNIETQQLINITIENKNKLDNYINLQIINLEKIKTKFIENYLTTTTTYIKIEEICDITNEATTFNTIYIQRNTNNAGYIDLTSTQYELSTNNYYLHIKNTNILQNYLYFILLYFENDFIKIANNNKTITISKKNIENFEIPLLNIDDQKHLINKINNINKMIFDLENLKNNNYNSVLFNFI